MARPRNRTFINREGFWRSGRDSLLPIPLAYAKPWKGRKLFLRLLRRVEMYQAQQRKHRKPSLRCCQFCDHEAPGVLFVFGDWEWPSSLLHYVQAHNLRPSLAFHEFIIGKELR